MPVANEFENFYTLPLNDEAQQCEIDKEMVVDQFFLRHGSGVVRRAVVLDIIDGTDGRRVIFREVSQS